MAMRTKALSLQDREKIARDYGAGKSPADIAYEIGVCQATIYSDLKRGYTGELDVNQRPAYDPVLAQRVYQENIRKRGNRRRASGE